MAKRINAGRPVALERAPSISEFYQSRGMTSKDSLTRRHKRLGYDPLDRLLQYVDLCGCVYANERSSSHKAYLRQARADFKRKKSLALANVMHISKDALNQKSNEQLEYRERVRELLREHIETMADAGIVFHHAFQAKRLGLSISLARYGEDGRQFVNVEETMPHCELYPGPLK